MRAGPAKDPRDIWDIEEERFLFASPEDLQGPEGPLLSKEESHHALRVWRLRHGDRIRGIDGEGNEFLAVIGESVGRRIQLQIEASRRSERESPWDIALGMPLLHRASRLDWILEKATELGVRSIRPIVTRRTTVIPIEERMSKRLVRWERVIISAMKQSGRAWKPRLTEPQDLEAVLNADQERRIVWAAPSGGRMPPAAALRQAGNGAFLALVGPQGGWDEQEEELLRRYPGWSVSLGPHRLRSETAVVNLLSLLQDRLLAEE
jgi:16S rRNA (uracil1498-N3)-methyltransferase